MDGGGAVWSCLEFSGDVPGERFSASFFHAGDISGFTVRSTEDAAQWSQC